MASIFNEDEGRRDENSFNEYIISWFTGARYYDSDIAMFLSVDPLAPDYPWNSPYAFSENRVIDAIKMFDTNDSFSLASISIFDSN